MLQITDCTVIIRAIQIQVSSVLIHKYVISCARVVRGEVEERGGIDAVASLTTSDKEIVRNPLAPKGLRRDGPDFFVAPPRRCYSIDLSSRLDLRTVALATSGNVFMNQDTSVLSQAACVWLL